MPHPSAHAILGIKKKPEAVFQNKFIKWLKQFPGYIIEYKYTSGSYAAKKFIPDVLFICNGVPIFFELKVGNNGMSAGQKQTKIALELCGAIHYELKEDWFYSTGKKQLETFFTKLLKVSHE